MKKHIFIPFLVVISISLPAQDAIGILCSSRAKCQSDYNGYYEMVGNHDCYHIRLL